MEVMFVCEGENGGVCWGQWRLPAGALGARLGRLGEIVCPVISPETLVVLVKTP